MGDSKKIQLSPEFLALSSGSKPKKTKPNLGRPTVNPAVQENLINKIQQYQQKQERKLTERKLTERKLTERKLTAANQKAKPTPEIALNANFSRAMPSAKERLESEFESEFDKSLHFLNSIANKAAAKHKPAASMHHNLTMKRGKIEKGIQLQVATELPPELQPAKPNVVTLALARPTTLSPPSKTQIALVPAAKTVLQNAAMAVISPAAPTSFAPTSSAPTASAPTSSAPPPTDTPASMTMKPNPPFGILKNGSKPTFRSFHGITYKNRPDRAQPAAPSNPRQAALQAAKTAFQAAKAPKVVKKRVTRTVKFVLGKHKNRTVSVLVGHNIHKQRVQHEHSLLRNTPLQDVKAYLRKHNLIKAGANMPNDVLRAMYENALLSGDLRNTRPDTRLHNFLHDK